MINKMARHGEGPSFPPLHHSEHTGRSGEKSSGDLNIISFSEKLKSNFDYLVFNGLQGEFWVYLFFKSHYENTSFNRNFILQYYCHVSKTSRRFLLNTRIHRQ